MTLPRATLVGVALANHIFKNLLFFDRACESSEGRTYVQEILVQNPYPRFTG